MWDLQRGQVCLQDYLVVGLQQHALFEYRARPVDLDQLALTTLSLHCGTILSRHHVESLAFVLHWEKCGPGKFDTPP